MNLSALAIRLAAVQALMSNTLAEDRVYDSRISDLDALTPEDNAPLIVVSTDDGSGTVRGRDIWAPDDAGLDLVIDIAVGARVISEVEDQNGDPVTVEELEIAGTDAGLEMRVNLMAYQVARVLFGDHGDPWQEVFKTFAINVRNYNIRRGAGIDKGGRYAMRQITYRIEPLAEPQPGQDLDPQGAWLPFISMLKQHSSIGLQQIGASIEAVIVGSPLTDEKAVRASLGLTDAETAGIGVAPMVVGDMEPIASVAVGEGTEALTVDAQTVADAGAIA